MTWGRWFEQAFDHGAVSHTLEQMVEALANKSQVVVGHFGNQQFLSLVDIVH